MAEKTGIAWTRSTFNPWIGCTKVSPGCENCYAEALDKRHRWGGAEHWGAGIPRHLTSAALWSQPVRWNKDAVWENENGRLRNPSWNWERPGFWPVFCASLADVFDNEVPDEWRAALWQLVAATPNLTWLLLTKRIGNATKMLPAMSFHFGGLKNVWLGASVVNQEEADRDIPKLLATPAAKRFVSYEPALGPVDFERYFEQYPDRNGVRIVQNNEGIDWIIVGGESSQGKAKARPFALSWARAVVAQCRAAGVPPFVKQIGSNPISPVGVEYVTKDRSGSIPEEWWPELQVQEFPS